MKNALKEINKEKNFLKKKLEIYENKLNELLNKNEENNDHDDFFNKSQIELGINEKNPFDINTNENDINDPLKTEKFTSA